MARIRTIDETEWATLSKSAGTSYHLYLVQEEEAGPVKIGIARNAFWRRTDLQSGNYRRINLCGVFECSERVVALTAEANVLAHFASRRIGGEWLDATPEEVIDFILSEIG